MRQIHRLTLVTVVLALASLPATAGPRGRGAGLVPAGASRIKSATRPPEAMRAIADDLRKREYHFSAAEGGAWTAPNRASNLRAVVSWEGVEVVSRTAGADGFRLALEFAAYGRQGCLAPVGEASLQARDNRVELTRAGVVEWYVNDARGLEQGFDLAWRPECDDVAQPVVLEMRLDTALHPRLTDAGRTVEFRYSGGGLAVLRYADLLVLDASGRPVPASLRVAAGRLRIEIDDGDAEYPLRVDPLLNTIEWDIESDQPLAFLGLLAVASAGDVNGDGYDDVIVGADEWDNDLNNQGGAWVYHGSATGLPTTPDWSAEGTQAGGHFGWNVSAAGDVNGDGYDDVTIAATSQDQFLPVFIEQAGLAYLYLGSPSGLQDAPAWSTVGGSGCETWTPGRWACLHVWRPAHGDFNGDGYDDVVINSYQVFESPFWGQGRVYDGSPAGLSNLPSWTWTTGILTGQVANSAGDVNGDGFDDIVVGNPGYTNGQVEEGQILIFLGSASGVSPTSAWSFETDTEFAFLGDVNSAINGWGGMGPAGAGDINGDGYGDVIAGAVRYTNGESGEGAVYVWLGSASFPLAPPTIFEGNQASTPGTNLAWVGWIADPAGDVNGDGYDDIVFGSPTYDDGGIDDAGILWVHHGSPGGIRMNPSWTITDSPGYDQGVLTATSAGDVNGDGYDDLIGGWGFWSNPETSEGRATIWHGFCDGPDADGDGRCVFAPSADCNDADSTIWFTPGEVQQLLFTDETTLIWSAPAAAGGSLPVYDTLRSNASSDFSAATCVESNDGADTTAVIAADPAPGQMHSFLVRAENDCLLGQGTLGDDFSGTPRSGPNCP